MRSSKKHQSVDWAGIHEKICAMMAPLRNPPDSINSEDARRRRLLTLQMKQHALIDLAKTESSKLLVQGQYELAIPGALQSLRLGMLVYGKGHIELVPSYLLLAEANMGLGRHTSAEEFLSLASWSVFKSTECSNALRSQLHRLFGKIYLTQGRMLDALQQLSLDIYYCSLNVGPEHIETAGGYYHIALVFLKQDNVEQSLAFFDKVVDIWYKFLCSLRQNDDETISDYLNDAKIGEAGDILQSIVETRCEYLGPQHIASGEASFVLGILYSLAGEKQKAAELYSTALSIYEVEVGADNELTNDIRHALEQLPHGDTKREPAEAAAAEN